MASLDGAAFSAIANFFGPQGVPLQVPLIIGFMESGLDPQKDNYASDGYPSYGLFQANTTGGMGQGHNPADLMNAEYNVNLVGPAIVRAFNDAGGMGAWQQAQQQGEWAVQAFVRKVHLNGLIPDEDAMNRNYANNWSAAVPAISQAWDMIQPPAAGAGGGQPNPAGSYYDQFEVTSGFGNDFYMDGPYTDPNTGQYYEHFNKGNDYGMSYGTPVQAVQPGTVVHVGDDGQGWGYRVVVQDGQGNLHNYGHVGDARVGVGDTVQAGQELAVVAPGGVSTGAHLSYDVYREHPNGGYEYLDPQQFLTGDLSGFTPVDPNNSQMASNYAPYIDAQAAQMAQYLQSLPEANDVEGMAETAWQAYSAAYNAGPMWEDYQGNFYSTQAEAQAANDAWVQANPDSPLKPGPPTQEDSEEYQFRIDGLLSHFMQLDGLSQVEIDAQLITLQDGTMSIQYDPAKLASLPQATQEQIQRILANQGTDLINQYRLNMNALRTDEYNLVGAWVQQANDNIGQLTEWARQNDIDIRDTAALNHELQRQYGRDLNEILQQGWQNQFDLAQTGYENEQGYTDRLNELAQLRWTLLNTHEQQEFDRLNQEYENEVQKFQNNLSLYGVDMDRAVADLDRWFGVREQNESRANLITQSQFEAQPWAIPEGHNGQFGASDFGGLAESIAEFAGLDPSQATMNFPTTMTIDPEGVMNRFDEAGGVGGQAPTIPGLPFGYEDVPGTPSLPGFTPFDPNSLTDPSQPPEFPAPPNLGQNWAPPPNLGVNWQAPGSMFGLPDPTSWMGGALPYQPYGSGGAEENIFANLEPGTGGYGSMFDDFEYADWFPTGAEGGVYPALSGYRLNPQQEWEQQRGRVNRMLNQRHTTMVPDNPFAGLRVA